VVLAARNMQTLASLYAIGVVGAIAINVGSTASHSTKEQLGRIERPALWVISAVMFAIWITIAYTKPYASAFLVTLLATGMALREVARRRPVRVPIPAAEVRLELETLPPLPAFDPSKRKILVASRANLNLLRFAFDEAKARDANLFVLFVREIKVALYGGRVPPMTPEEDEEARRLFAETERMAREMQVPLQKIYVDSPSPSEVILDFAATHAVDLVILGVSRRAAMLRALRGDVISNVADNLPAESTLLIHA
jgi:nucleotide-binding universal stress UspA family protein